MLRNKNHEAGVTHIVAIIAVLVISTIGIVALRISSAHQLRNANSTTVCHSLGSIIVAYKGQSCTITSDSSGVHCKVNGAVVPCLGINPPATTGTSSSVCTANGFTVTPPNGQSCSITSDSSGVHCKIGATEVTCVNNGGSNTGSGGTGTPTGGGSSSGSSTGVGGSSTCSSNGKKLIAPAGHNCAVTSDSTGVHCLLDGKEVPCSS